MDNSKVRIHYGEQVKELSLPSGWQLLGNLRTGELPPIGKEKIAGALANPVGTRRLEEIARGKKSAVIIAGDVTRPTQGEVALPMILGELNRGGIKDENILLIMGGGSHQQPQDLNKAFVQKYGQEVVKRVKTIYHNPDQDLVPMGKTRRGHSIEISKFVAAADVKVAFGGILPHPLGGYSGGAKAILPSVAGRETCIQNHLMIVEPGVGLGMVEGNPVREEMEEVAGIVGLDFILNLVMDAQGAPVGAVSGHFREAHRQGVALAKRIFQAEVTRPAQVVFSSGYPFDIHFYQSLRGPCSVLDACEDGGTIVHLTPSHEGVRAGTRKLFATVRESGYRSLFARLKSGERQEASVRNFFFPEINIGSGMTIFQAMEDRRIRIVVVTDNIPGKDLEDMGFGHAATVEEAVAGLHREIPRAEVAAAFNAKVIITRAAQSSPSA